jgi:hypothetical protein
MHPALAKPSLPSVCVAKASAAPVQRRRCECVALREFFAGMLYWGATEDESDHKKENGVALIELRLRELSQLFNSLDPSPFIDADLDDGASEFLLNAVSETPDDVPIKVVVMCERAPRNEATANAAQAVRNFFHYRSELCRLRMRQTFRLARQALVSALIFMFAVLFLQVVVQRNYDENAESVSSTRKVLYNTAIEGLNVLAWVTLWGPLNLFFYDWWPLSAEHRNLLRLEAAAVEIQEIIGMSHLPSAASLSQLRRMGDT